METKRSLSLETAVQVFTDANRGSTEDTFVLLARGQSRMAAIENGRVELLWLPELELVKSGRSKCSSLLTELRHRYRRHIEVFVQSDLPCPLAV